MAWNTSSLTCRLTCPALINKSWIVTCGWKTADFCRAQESPVFACFVFCFVLMLPWTLFSTTYELHVELASIGDVFVSAFKALGSGTMMTLNICYFRASLAMRKPFTYQDLFWEPAVCNPRVKLGSEPIDLGNFSTVVTFFCWLFASWCWLLADWRKKLEDPWWLCIFTRFCARVRPYQG